MSIENVVLFTRAVNDKLLLRERLAATDHGSEWIEIARDVGFEFTLEEFVSTLGETLARAVRADNVVQEYRSAVDTMSAGVLTRAMSKIFIGGMPRNCDAWSAGVEEQSQPPVRRDSVR
jgi:hypothetical protein